MDIFVWASISITAVCLSGISFVIYKIVEEEREKREKLEFIKVFSKRYNKGCRYCRCFPCQCGS